MTWADFYLICFAVGFAFSFLSFLLGGIHWHLPFNIHGHVHVPHPHVHVGHAPAGQGQTHGTAVAPLNPMLGLYAAVTRATLDGKHPNGWVPEQKISIEEAIEAYTLGSAYAEFQEKDKGSITPGKLADLILVSDNLLKIDPRAIRDAKVEMTMVAGKIVYGGPPE